MDPALGDVKVRQALNYAFDREGLLTALQFDHGTVTTQVFPASSDAYDPELDSYYTTTPRRRRSSGRGGLPRRLHDQRCRP